MDINFFGSDFVSNIIQTIGIIVSLGLGYNANKIAHKTLKQNSIMIEESTRPYICVYGSTFYIHGKSHFYLIVKNFGQSIAYIKSFRTTIDLEKLSFHPGEVPFSNLANTSLMPGQGFHCKISLPEAEKNGIKFIKGSVSYASDTHKYNEKFSINLKGNYGNLTEHEIPLTYTTLSDISEVLQEMQIHSL